jgi:hypothetical protein
MQSFCKPSVVMMIGGIFYLLNVGEVLACGQTLCEFTMHGGSALGPFAMAMMNELA